MRGRNGSLYPLCVCARRLSRQSRHRKAMNAAVSRVVSDSLYRSPRLGEKFSRSLSLCFSFYTMKPRHVLHDLHLVIANRHGFFVVYFVCACVRASVRAFKGVCGACVHVLETFWPHTLVTCFHISHNFSPLEVSSQNAENAKRNSTDPGVIIHHLVAKRIIFGNFITWLSFRRTPCATDLSEITSSCA